MDFSTAAVARAETNKDGTISIALDEGTGLEFGGLDDIRSFIETHGTPTLYFVIAQYLKDWLVKQDPLNPETLDPKAMVGVKLKPIAVDAAVIAVDPIVPIVEEKP